MAGRKTLGLAVRSEGMGPLSVHTEYWGTQGRIQICRHVLIESEVRLG